MKPTTNDCVHRKKKIKGIILIITCAQLFDCRLVVHIDKNKNENEEEEGKKNINEKNI